jgi:cardiolipin synthase
MPSNEKTTVASETATLVHSGEDYFRRLEQIIRDSKSEIHIQTYIFENDSTGIKIAEALKDAASRNVKIYILLDGFGSFSFPSVMINDLKQSGINIRFFAPLFSANSFYLGRRLHHKVIVADSKIALIGGINIADKYQGTATEAPWLDFAVQINDEINAKPLQKLCSNIYFKEDRLRIKKRESALFTLEETAVNILQNDWLKRKNEISNAYIKSFRNAKNEIIIVGSYFLPGRRLTNALKKASRNNVKIKLILSGISDVTLSKRATYYIYSTLLDYNVELYEWNKSVLHGKAAVVDNLWTTIGSFNLNNLSSYGSIEMNVAINSAEFSNKYVLYLNEIIAQCERITPESIKKRHTISSDFKNWLSYWTARVILIIVTYFPYKRFRKFY